MNWSKIRLWFYLAKGSLSATIKYGCKMTMTCEWCGRSRWAEEIIINCGVCASCFDASYEYYMKEMELQ